MDLQKNEKQYSTSYRHSIKSLWEIKGKPWENPWNPLASLVLAPQPTALSGLEGKIWSNKNGSSSRESNQDMWIQYWGATNTYDFSQFKSFDDLMKAFSWVANLFHGHRARPGFCGQITFLYISSLGGFWRDPSSWKCSHSRGSSSSPEYQKVHCDRPRMHWKTPASSWNLAAWLIKNLSWMWITVSWIGSWPWIWHMDVVGFLGCPTSSVVLPHPTAVYVQPCASDNEGGGFSSSHPPSPTSFFRGKSKTTPGKVPNPLVCPTHANCKPHPNRQV